MEITYSPQLSAREEALIDMHSVLNVLNIVLYELLCIEDMVGECSEIDILIVANANLGERLANPEEAWQQVLNVDQFIRQVEETLGTVAARNSLESLPTYSNRIANLRSIFNILRVRAAEIVARGKGSAAWVPHTTVQLKQNFEQVFKAIETNSYGRYRIVTEADQQGAEDYLIVIDIQTHQGGIITMPAIFQDVMRDLIANARKYTPPGGHIRSLLKTDPTQLTFEVQDNGRGIPPAEIESVVLFGERGSNVMDQPTRGGGFGLTKAFAVTRKCGGHMWIESDGIPGHGTTVRIVLPAPQ